MAELPSSVSLWLRWPRHTASASNGFRTQVQSFLFTPHPPCAPRGVLAQMWPIPAHSRSLPARRLYKSSSTQQRGPGRSPRQTREQMMDLPEGMKSLCSGVRSECSK